MLFDTIVRIAVNDSFFIFSGLPQCSPATEQKLHCFISGSPNLFEPVGTPGILTQAGRCNPQRTVAAGRANQGVRLCITLKSNTSAFQTEALLR